MENKLFYSYAPNCSNLIKQNLQEILKNKKPVLLCIGTDKILADVVGPLTAEILRQENLPCFIYGGLKSPITNKNLKFASEYISLLHPYSPLIVIDSMTTSTTTRLGHILITKKYSPLLAKIDINAACCIYGITSITNTHNLLAQSRLEQSYTIAKTIAKAFLSLSNQNIQSENFVVIPQKSRTMC